MKRLLALLLAAVMAMGIFTACTRQEPDVDPEEPEETTIPEDTAGEEVTEDILLCDPRISEVMPDNRNLTLGHELDWVELYNPGDVTIDLSGYYLTDDLSDPEAMDLSGQLIPAGEYAVIVLTDAAPFLLSEAGETVYLTWGGEVISQMRFEAPTNGESFDPNGACTFPTPGYANTEEGYHSYRSQLPLPELTIHEALPEGSDYPLPGAAYDWVEVQNTTGEPLDLNGYCLEDKWGKSDRYYFPNVTLEPGEFYLVLCSGNPELGENHAPFKLSPGETIYLSCRGSYVDALVLPEDLQNNESYGISGNVPVYLAEPTPGGENTEGFLTGIGAPEANVATGLYEEAVTVTLSGEGTIYYTLDGRRPTTSSQVYSEPVTVDDVTTIRAFCVSNGRTSPMSAYTYVIGAEHDLPVVVVSIPDSSLWGGEGILSNVKASYEYEAVLTLIEDGEEKFSAPFGFRLHGNDSRLGAKKNFQLRFRGEYGVGKLEYRLFDDRDIEEFDSLLLKGGSEDWDIANMRDELATSIANGTTALYTQAMKPVVLYLGGEYWGVYYLRERFSDEYVASHMGVSPESVDILFSSDGYVQCGSRDDFDDLKTFVKTHDMRTTENYAYLISKIDENSLMDWYICRTYMEDTDIANIRRCRSVEGDGEWHWMYFDLDWSFYSRGSTPFTDIVDMYGADRTLMHGLLASEAGQDAFLKRYAYLLRTVLNEAYITGKIDAIVSAIESEMPRDRDRWNRSVSYWESNVQAVRNFVKDDKRTTIILKDLKNYFSLSDGEMEYYFGDLWG